MKQSQFYYLLRRGLFSGGSSIIKKGLVMFNKFTTAGISHPAQGSAEFNGSSDYIEASSPFSGSTTDFTISFWMNATAGSPLGFGQVSDGSNYAIFYKASSLLKWEVRGTFGSQNLSTTSNPYSGNWEFITLSVGGSTGSIYVNGSKEATATASALFSGDLLIGRYGGGLNLDGNLANVAIWNRALTSDEINSVMWKSYQALSGTESNGLQAWYSLDDITSPAASLANMEQLATDKNLVIENANAITSAINKLS